MTILYCLVARGGFILAEYINPQYTGEFSAVATLLSRVEMQSRPEDRDSFSFDSNPSEPASSRRLSFHYIKSNSLTYVVMCPAEFPRSDAFDFLKEMQEEFLSNFGTRGYTASAYEFNADFRPIAQRLVSRFMESHSAKINSDALHRARINASEVQDILKSNIEEVVARGEKIEDLYVRVDSLNDHATLLNRKSRSLKSRFRCENMRMKFAVVVVVLVVLYVALTAGCGGFSWPKCT